jgi:hypothetical protein
MTKIIELAELLGHMDTSDGRRLPHYKCKSETTLTNTVTGEEYDSEDDMKTDVNNPSTATKEEHIRRDVRVFAPSLADMLGEVPKEN